MKNKKIVIIALVSVFIILALGYYFIFSNKQSGQTQKPFATQAELESEVVPTLIPESIGLIVSLRPDKKALKFEITKISDIDSIDYQISYTKEVKGEEVPEGLIGSVTVGPEDEKIETKYREFGTCSSGICRYDIVISPVKVTLKVTKKDGKIYEVEQSVEI